ncbi:MAG: bifunctional DNA-formamidopyrimidine glycosylase/DNA-(apurinic or apyrimidinic site) lyase [Patescibacteria group bacterium]|nr:bifunctional DNA-formamidopyrimidine glycosylase/DNA-(apurinic or apyrimidinic site) lyase [Patescibacteria group bacterium]
MPELPEIETIKQDLADLIKNKKIRSIKINLAKQVQGSAKNLITKVKNRRVVKVHRRAKILILDLDNHWHLVFHLKMTGQLIYVDKNKIAGGGHPIKHDLQNLPNKYSHVIFNFTDGSQLFFNDTRQFGWVKLVADRELEKNLDKYGPEPLDSNFSLIKFKNQILKRAKTPIKPLLMDQKIIAGIGNIYAQEACFCAKILPTRKAENLKLSEIKKLYQCLKKILKQAIKKRGTSSSDYVDALGRSGSMNDYLKIYGRADEKCYCCGTRIKKIKQQQRSTCYCPKCQK